MGLVVIGARGIVSLESWAGRTDHPCTIVGETPKRWRVVFDRNVTLPRHRFVVAGEETVVSKARVKLQP